MLSRRGRSRRAADRRPGRSRRASSSRARWASARALSSAACWAGSAACAGLLALAVGQVAGLAGQPVGLARPRPASRAPRRSGVSRTRRVELVADGVLPGLEPVELGAAARGGRRPRRRSVCWRSASSWSLPARARPPGLRSSSLRWSSSRRSPTAPAGSPAWRRSASAAGRILVLPVRSSIARADSASSSAICRAGRASWRVAGSSPSDPGELLEPLDQVAQGPPRVPRPPAAAGVPSAFAASGRVGGLAQLFRLLPAGSDVLPERVERRLDRRPPHPRQPRRDRLGTRRRSSAPSGTTR